MIFLLLSCMGNDEPKFETYNGQPIKYLLGFAYVGSLMDQEFVVEAGETLDMGWHSRSQWRRLRDVVSSFLMV